MSTAAFHSCLSAGSSSIIHGASARRHLTRYAFKRPRRLKHATGHGAAEGLQDRFTKVCSGSRDKEGRILQRFM